MSDKDTHQVHEEKPDHMAHERDETPDVEGHIKSSAPDPARSLKSAKSARTARLG